MSRAALLLGAPSDAHVQALSEELARERVEPRVLDPRRFPARATLSVSVAAKDARVRVGGDLVDLDDVRVGWFSSRESVRVSSATLPAARKYARAAAIAGLITLRQAPEFPWVNDPWRAAKAGDKVWQLIAAKRRGLAIPETLLTNDPAAFRRFVRKERRAAVKSPSGSAGLADDERILTQLVTPRDLKEAASVRLAPVLAQAYVPKATEIRATVVGTRVLAVEIDSQGTPRTRVDWRRYDHRTRYEKTRLPARVERACAQVARDCGLEYSGIDLIRTPDDEFVFLEANSEPAWLWVEDLVGLPITSAIAKLLRRHAT